MCEGQKNMYNDSGQYLAHMEVWGEGVFREEDEIFFESQVWEGEEEGLDGDKVHGLCDLGVGSSRAIKRAELTAFLCLLGGSVAPTTAHVDNKGNIVWVVGEEKCSAWAQKRRTTSQPSGKSDTGSCQALQRRFLKAVWTQPLFGGKMARL